MDASDYGNRKRYQQREAERKANFARDAAQQRAEIGKLPAVGDPELKEACRYDLLRFATEYFPLTTGSNPLADCQVSAIKRTERAMLKFARNINVLPRGFVKSTILENAFVWAALYGHRRFLLFFGCTGDLANQGIHAIKTELENNELLQRDFPEVCYPVQCLGGKYERCRTQTYQGKRTLMEWTKDTLVLPWIPGSDARGVIIEAYGLLAPPRGKRYRLPDGSQPRPDFCGIDDPQTDESAISAVQTAKRIRYIKNSILRLGAHGSKASAVMNATQMADGDLVEQMTDRKLHKDWSSVKSKMVPSLPKHLDDWWLTKYADIRHDYDDDDIDGQEQAAEKSTEFYRNNHKIMNEGAEVAWDHIRLEAGEVDALQHAMNILVDEGPEVFYAECQNEPRAGETASIIEITDETKDRVSGLGEQIVSDRASEVVFGIDVHDELLYWTVAAASQDFTGGPIAYGTWPEQPTQWFNLRSAKRKLTDHYHSVSVEEAIEQGTRDLVERLCTTPWIMADGRSLPIGAGLVDAGHKPDEVASAIRRSGHLQVLTSKGIGITPLKKPMAEYDCSPKRVFRCGPNPKRPRWYLPRDQYVDGVYRVHFDTNYWKSATAARLTQPLTAAGAWELFGDHRTDHAHYVSHLMAERPVKLSAEGRTVDVWTPVPNRDNHWLDTTVLCAVALSLCGCYLPTGVAMPSPAPTAKKKPKPPPEDDDMGDYFVTAR